MTEAGCRPPAVADYIIYTNDAGEVFGAFATPLEVVRDREGRAELRAALAHHGDLRLAVPGEAIERHDRRLAEEADVLHVLVQVRQSRSYRLGIAALNNIRRITVTDEQVV